MRSITRLASAMFAVAPAADVADGQGVRDERLRRLHSADAFVTTSEADSGATVSLAPGMELAVALRARPGAGRRWRILQFELVDPAGAGEPQVQVEPKPDRNAIGIFARETFRFRVKRPGETGLAFGYFRPRERTPPEKQARILVRTG